jgi:hypothetical protein
MKMHDCALALTMTMALVSCGGDDAGPLGADEAARACVTSFACGLRFSSAYGRTGVSGCAVVLAHLNDAAAAAGQLAGPSELRCLARAAGDCAAARRCLDDGHDAAECSDSTVASCTGSEVRYCERGGSARFDCASAGRRCADDGNGAGAYCAGDPPAVDGSAPACSDPGAQVDLYHYDGVRCDGDTLVACRGGHEARVDCRRLGLGCFAVRDTDRYNPSVHYDVARCAAAAACDPFTTAASCDGSKLTFCNNGALLTVDCAADAGGAACDASQGGRCTK